MFRTVAMQELKFSLKDLTRKSKNLSVTYRRKNPHKLALTTLRADY
jgi:hypothetical protein